MTAGEDVTLRQDRVAIHRHYFWVRASENTKSEEGLAPHRRSGEDKVGQGEHGALARFRSTRACRARSRELTHQPGTAAVSP